MQPRLSSSSKWTAFPTDFNEKIGTVFSKNFAPEAEHGEFLVEGRIYPNEILLRIGYLEKGRLRQMNFEASLEYSQEKHEAMARIYTAVDALGSMVEEYFMDPEEAEFPLAWKAFEFEGEEVYLQISTVNTRLEAEADRLLGLDSKDLVQEAAESEDALEKAIVDDELAAARQKEIRSKGPSIN